MAVEITLSTPLADALSTVIQPKLVEIGWSTGGADDSALAEYIILMLVNGKTQDQIAAELSGDLLNLGPDDPGAIDFSHWLFEQVHQLDQQLHRGQVQSASEATIEADAVAAAGPRPDSKPDPHSHASDSAGPDVEMNDGRNGQAEGQIPTAPKSMRNGNRNKRLFGQMSKAMDRTNDTILHRVRAHQGTERIDGHSREPPRGPRTLPNPPPVRGLRMPGGRMMGGMNAGGMGNSGPTSAMMAMSPQQQIQLFAMYEEQARMMSQILSPQQQQQMFVRPAFNPNMGMGMGMTGPMGGGPMGGPMGRPSPPTPAPGRSLFERVQPRPLDDGGRSNGHHSNLGGHASSNDDAHGSTSVAATFDGRSPRNELTSSMEVEAPNEGNDDDPAATVCRFNLACIKEDCAYAHQSPAAPPGTTIDVTDECSFGAACKSRKCVARHPSPAKKVNHQAEQDCKFFPNCTNPACPFRHPTMPLCRNGADCTRDGCRFTHLKAACKYNPCLNPTCPYKHLEGQKRGAFDDKVWIANNVGERSHVSERKFVDADGGEEELIIPSISAPTSQPGSEVVA